MARAAEIAKIALLLSLLVLVCEIAYTIHRLRPKIEVTVANVDRTIIVAGAASSDVEKAARAWQAASQAQAQQSTALLVESKKTLAAARAAIEDVDANVIPAVSKTVEQQNASLLQTQEQLRRNLADMQAATAQLQRVLADADKAVSDPEIAEATKRLADASAELARTMGNLDGATADVKQVADRFRDDFLKPRNRIWAYIQAITGLGAKAGNISTLAH